MQSAFCSAAAVYCTCYYGKYGRITCDFTCFNSILVLPSPEVIKILENVFVKHYAPNHMPDPKGEWSLKENNNEELNGICSKVYQFIYILVCNYMPIIRILAIAVLQLSRSKGCSYTKCPCPKKESNATENLQNRFKG